MLRRIVQLFIVVTGGTLGYLYIPEVLSMMNLSWQVWIQSVVGALLGALILFLLTFWVVDYIVNFLRWVEDTLVRAPVADLLFGSLGLIVGLLIAYLVNNILQDIKIQIVNQILPIFLTFLLGYFGFQVGFKRKDEFLNLLAIANRKDKKLAEDELTGAESIDRSMIPKEKILDTSVIIDGRIADICETHFLEGTIVIPQFVLEELQHIADSSDGLKRNRGRRGLDILNRLQKDLPVKVEIYEGDFEDIHEVDSKLVKLAKVMDGIVVTNDFNLNKVCEFQNVQVLNINDLANAVKPVVLPGEEMTIQIIKDGKEQKQGIGYLDDGTMIVVEEGKDYIGRTIEVIVTSVLQTSAGRMIFAKPKSLEKAL
ncbi:PIN/TRAM domain-containing protein [Halobacillus naozhouensis]|uniref:PIN/TRAM domain-containing protein n=1 Tax=Halobacillus naozhouensis TaxID=554880 RepID=A0ABY8IYS6_9BACI|nr:PIN/TRAM domain-containing protein [Halobacillus naozhouensis]WFT74977.1 PIN/TRAM domain-containing protein [Halobacillus naozhouensis]